MEEGQRVRTGLSVIDLREGQQDKCVMRQMHSCKRGRKIQRKEKVMGKIQSIKGREVLVEGERGEKGKEQREKETNRTEGYGERERERENKGRERA